MDKNRKENMVCVYTANNIVEFTKIKCILNQYKIDIHSQTFDDSAYNGIYILQKGFGKIWVTEDNEGKAKQIISQLNKMI